MTRKLMFFPNVVRRVLYRAQHGLCAGCGEPIGRYMRVSVDHVIPASLKGPDRLGNLVAMHGRCNGSKGNRLPNGCELIWLLAVNARLDVFPLTMRNAT